MPTQLLKLGLQDASSLADTQTFSVFQEGAEEASRQAVEIEANSSIIENEREIITSKVYSIMATGDYSNAKRTQLRTWADASTELKVSGFGLDGSILQADRAITAKFGAEDNASMRIMSKEEGVGGYASNGKHTSGMSYCKNGLALYKWQEGATTGIAAGWQKTGGVTSWSGELQSFTTTGASDVFLYRDIYFPFPNKQVNFGVDVEGTITVTDSASVQIVAYDSAGSTIGSASTTEIASTGVNDIARVLPSGTEYIRVQVQINDVGALTFKNASLNLGNDYLFEEFLT